MKPYRLLAALAAAVSLSFVSGMARAQVDADAARALAKKNDCLKCHSVDKEKKGPSYRKIAEKFKGKADAEDRLTRSLTTGPKVKLDDGTEEEHKVIKAKEADLKNLIGWILAQ